MTKDKIVADIQLGMDNLVDCMETLRAAMTDTYNAAVNESAAQIALTNAENDVLLTVDPKDLGGNKEVRDAAIAKKCGVEVIAHQEATFKINAAKHAQSIAQLEYDTCPRLLSASEAVAGVVGGE